MWGGQDLGVLFVRLIGNVSYESGWDNQGQVQTQSTLQCQHYRKTAAQLSRAFKAKSLTLHSLLPLLPPGPVGLHLYPLSFTLSLSFSPSLGNYPEG